MRIDSSAISMHSSSTLIEKYHKRESLRYWVGPRQPDSSQQEASKALSQMQPPDILELTDEAKKLLADNCSSLTGIEDDDSEILDISDKDKQKMLMLQAMLESLTGKKMRFLVPKRIKLDDSQRPIKIQELRPENPTKNTHGWGLEYDYHESYYERQTLSFSSNGIVKTADGREISFSVELNMDRQFYSEQNIQIRAGDAVKVDPLVINFDTAISDLTDQKIEFDLDSNGTPEQISFVTQGSGFLALDLNSDGRINDGSELFGPNSGNGFDELAAHDSDGNNWIDENDPIFEKLRIWTKDENGNDVLFALGQKGIGAIYLGNISTPYDIKNSENEHHGSISRTGVFLKEDGTPGTIQHIDLVL